MSCCGFNLNQILSYKTPKYVDIKDWRLGALQKLFMCIIFVRIVGIKMWYQCGHLKPVPVIGSARASIQQPTLRGCNPFDDDCNSDYTPLSQLPYCNQFVSEGNEAAANVSDEAERGKRDGKHEARRLEPQRKADCVMWDAVHMTRGRTPVPGTIFIPTRVTSYSQKVGCKPDAANGYSCHSKPYVNDPDQGAPRSVFVADIENFSMLINNAVMASDPDDSGIVSGSARDFTGYLDPSTRFSRQYLHNGDRHIQGRLRHMNATTGVADEYMIGTSRGAAGPFGSVYSADAGDYISIADLLKLADPRGASLLDAPRLDGNTMRWEGAVLSVDIEYTNEANMDPFGHSKPRYIMSADFLPMRQYKFIHETSHDDSAGTRTASSVHGLLVLIQVHGQIRRFSLTYLLTVLTTAMVSFAMAATVTDFFMMYVMTFSSKYTILKYQPTQDFGRLRATLRRLVDHHGDNYDPLEHKPIPHADILNCMAERRAVPEGQDLLFILLKFEQRLNRLDGVDEYNAIITDDHRQLDRGAHYIRQLENGYKFGGLLSSRYLESESLT